MRCESNAPFRGTNDGIDLGGLRIANELCALFEKRYAAGPYRLHFIGHSLGGLYLRAAFFYLHRRGFFTPARIPFVRPSRHDT